MVVTSPFLERPLAPIEDLEAEHTRVLRLHKEDPIALQDIINTSEALVEAAKAKDLEELKSVVANAEEGEFLQSLVMKAFVIALTSVSLELVQAFIGWGMPVGHDQLTQTLHLVCEATTRENFSDAWRIVQLLVEGNSEGRIDINMPRSCDGWTPLCIACSNACLPLAFKLLDMGADPNMITRSNDTPMSLVTKKRADDSDEQREARGIIKNMLSGYGGQLRWRDALAQSRKPQVKPIPEADIVGSAEDCAGVASKSISKTHTRFTG